MQWVAMTAGHICRLSSAGIRRLRCGTTLHRCQLREALLVLQCWATSVLTSYTNRTHICLAPHCGTFTVTVKNMTCGGIEFIVYVSLAKSRSENECDPKDTLVEPVPTVLSSNQSTPVAKESGANTHPWRIQFRS